MDRDKVHTLPVKSKSDVLNVTTALATAVGSPARILATGCQKRKNPHDIRSWAWASGRSRRYGQYYHVHGADTWLLRTFAAQSSHLPNRLLVFGGGRGRWGRTSGVGVGCQSENRPLSSPHRLSPFKLPICQVLIMYVDYLHMHGMSRASVGPEGSRD